MPVGKFEGFDAPAAAREHARKMDLMTAIGVVVGAVRRTRGETFPEGGLDLLANALLMMTVEQPKLADTQAALLVIADRVAENAGGRFVPPEGLR